MLSGEILSWSLMEVKELISFNIPKNGPKFNFWCMISSHQLLKGERYVLFTSELADKGAWKVLFTCVVYFN